MESKETVGRFKWCWRSFCVVFLCRRHFVRDLVVLGALAVSFGTVSLTSWRISRTLKNIEQTVAQERQLTEEEDVQKEKRELADIQAYVNVSNWVPYQNVWYGFLLKYPNKWLDPVVQESAPGAMWEKKIQFRSGLTDEQNPFEGFDVVVYDVAKVKQLANTGEFPKLKNAELFSESECVNIDGHLLETGDYPAEEIYIPSSDACYNAALFFSNTRDNYMYTLVPKIRDGAGLAGDPAEEIKNHLPEFFAMVSTWRLIDIRRPGPVLRIGISAPSPVSAITVGGRQVCAKKNDHPGKSKQGKGRHLDMECCLDPDEYPNPHCYYSPEKYGKYLKSD